MVRLTSPNIQLEKFTANALCSPQSVVCCHFLDQADYLGRQLRLSRARLGFMLPDYAEELTMPAQQRLRLDKVKGLFPGSNHPGEEHQKKPVPLSIHRAFDLSMQDEQLMSQQRVFRQQFGFASGQISKRSEHKGGRQWFDPRQTTFLERVQAKTDALLE